ncbi:hypothetical protein Tco_1205388, partial [Tanacetum coccineum]
LPEPVNFSYARNVVHRDIGKRVSMIVDAIKNMNNRDPPKQVKETDAANVVVGVNEAVYQVKEKGRQKK